mmetsp:Transcript_20773/g.48196  ORF Transcript_20773/g.48196 Transcript_20773/m.48196 type:complete len:456 (-) Transcript_20773:2720-4087(-)
MLLRATPHSKPRKPMHKAVTPLQMKGILTLFLFSLATKYQHTSIFAEAATDQKNNGGFFGRPSVVTTTAVEPQCSAADGTCTASTVPHWKNRFFKLNNYRKKKKADSPYCLRCVENCLDLPRGGHSHSHTHQHAAEEILTAAATASGAVAPYGIPLNMWKVLFQAFLTTLNVVCWLVPLRSKQISENQLALSLANAFSGGVFLSLAFTHLIPECTHGFGADWPEAAPYGLILFGYLLIFFVEKVAFDAHDILHEMQAGGGGHSHSGHSHSHSHNNNNKQLNGNANNKQSSSTVSASSSSDSAASTGRSAVILLGALGVHSVLEMMALGLSDSFGDSALLTMSIALHQPAESIALLVAFLKSGMPKNQILQYLSIFSCMGPIGVALGMAVNEYAAPVVDSIFLAIVAGTFVYVGATEVIPEEWEDSSYKWTKFGALMTGIFMIVGITQYTHSMGAH